MNKLLKIAVYGLCIFGYSQYGKAMGKPAPSPELTASKSTTSTRGVDVSGPTVDVAARQSMSAKTSIEAQTAPKVLSEAPLSKASSSESTATASSEVGFEIQSPRVDSSMTLDLINSEIATLKEYKDISFSKADGLRLKELETQKVQQENAITQNLSNVALPEAQGIAAAKSPTGLRNFITEQITSIQKSLFSKENIGYGKTDAPFTLGEQGRTTSNAAIPTMDRIITKAYSDAQVWFNKFDSAKFNQWFSDLVTSIRQLFIPKQAVVVSDTATFAEKQNALTSNLKMRNPEIDAKAQADAQNSFYGRFKQFTSRFNSPAPKQIASIEVIENPNGSGLQSEFGGKKSGSQVAGGVAMPIAIGRPVAEVAPVEVVLPDSSSTFGISSDALFL